MDMSINFPNLGIHLDNVGKTVSIFGFSIAYYGIVIAAGMLLALLLICQEAKRSGQSADNYMDLVLLAIVTGVIGARIYYVIFAWDIYKDNLLEIFNLRHGGLAIYGGIIAAVIAIIIYCRKKKLQIFQVLDVCALGVLVGQILGRWGNFFNREAFGGYTDNLFAMQLPVSAVRSNEITQAMWDHVVTIGSVDYIQVHPTFLYESLWNLVILLFLLWYRKHKKFQGEMFGIYVMGYGIGRFWIEGLRTDQLLLPVVNLPVSQLLGACFAVCAAAFMIYKRMHIAKAAAEDTKTETEDTKSKTEEIKENIEENIEEQSKVEE